MTTQSSPFSCIAITPNDQYRLADVAFYPADGNRALVHAKVTDATSFLHATYVDLLKHCREFRTLDDHISSFCQGRQCSERVMQGLRHKLQHLAEEGYLVSRSRLHSLFTSADQQTVRPHLTSIGIPTCNRVEALQRGMTSYVEHSQRFGHAFDFVVVDDSKASSTRETYRHMLSTLKARYGVNIAYAGLEEKTAFAKKLSEVGDIPAEIVSWTCLGDKWYDTSAYKWEKAAVGANRNALLLHTVGECIFTSDDDLICRVAASPGFKEGLALSSRGNPLEYWFYPDRERALESAPSVEQDFFALHEQWLGQDPKAAIASYNSDNLLSTAQADSGFLHSLATQPGNVILTAHGVIGDGSHETTDVLFITPIESFKRLMSSEQAYRSAHLSREMAQVSNQITLTDTVSPPMGMNIGGLDNRDLLPPFPPVGAYEDIAFGCMLSTCFPKTYGVYLPWVLLHTPLECRSYSAPIFDVPFYHWVPGLIKAFHPTRAGTPADHLYQLGDYLEGFGRLPRASFEEQARQLLWRGRETTISRMVEFLQARKQDGFFLASWKQEVEAHCARLQQSKWLPTEQLLRGGPDIAQRSIVQFAQILKWWPLMLETARRLRAEGYRLAQPV